MQSSAARIDASTPRKRSALGTLLAAIVSFLIHFVVTILIIVALVKFVPAYILLFKAYDAEMPAITIWLLQLSELSNNYWYLIVLAFMVFEAPISLGVQFLPDRLRWLKACWFDGYLVAAFLFMFWFSLVLALPIKSLGSRVVGAH